MTISSTPTDATGDITNDTSYSSGAKSITVQLTGEVVLTSAGHTPLLVEANTGVLAPYVVADLATFY